jgi:hypothetical protein
MGQMTSSQNTSNRRVWIDYLNGPLYVPREGRHVLKLLASGGPNAFTEELERLAALGSPWASAILGYLALMPGPDGKRDALRAIDLCKVHASAGYAYAQFILAWALIYSGQPNLAFQTMKKATLSNFPPATVDFAGFIWYGWGTKERYFTHAVAALRRADRVGHKAAFNWRCAFYRSGKFGLVRCAVGYLLAPLGRLQYFLAMLRDPFSCRVFVFQTNATGPLIRLKPRYGV